MNFQIDLSTCQMFGRLIEIRIMLIHSKNQMAKAKIQAKLNAIMHEHLTNSITILMQLIFFSSVFQIRSQK